MRVLVIRMNNTKPPFDNVHSRKCLSHAFNYKGFIQRRAQGLRDAQRRADPAQPVGRARRT